MGKHRKVGRPKGSKSRKKSGCKTLTVYRRVKGRIVKVRGVNRKTCLK